MLTCDVCNREFQQNTHETELNDGSLQVVMVCPHCEHRYEVVTIDETGRRLHERLDRMRASGLHTSPMFAAVMKQYQRHVHEPVR